jgi:hypothetical protein
MKEAEMAFPTNSSWLMQEQLERRMERETELDGRRRGERERKREREGERERERKREREREREGEREREKERERNFPFEVRMLLPKLPLRKEVLLSKIKSEKASSSSSVHSVRTWREDCDWTFREGTQAA